jgi:HSP20 family protein
MSHRPRHQSYFYLEVSQSGGETLWRPPVDIYRTQAGWLLKFELPGVRADDVEVRTIGSTLVVRGTKRDWIEPGITSVHMMEVTYGRFERAIELACSLDQARLTLEFRDGNLLVRISI